VLVLSEKGKVARFENGAREVLLKTQFDGCVDCAGQRADFVVRNKQKNTVVVELKGKDVLEAGAQISNTVKFLSENGKCVGKPSALVVCAKVPLGVSSIQELTLSLKKAGVGKVKVKTREWRGEFASLF